MKKPGLPQRDDAPAAEICVYNEVKGLPKPDTMTPSDELHYLTKLSRDAITLRCISYELPKRFRKDPSLNDVAPTRKLRITAIGA